MGMLAPAARVVLAAAAKAMLPPPPPDITAWCEANIVFDDRSPMPGPFRIERFAFLREIHEVLSPEHPAREVTVRGSAQFGKTVSIIQPTLGAWHAYTALDSLVVHPTQTAAKEWVMNKWLPMRRATPALRDIFGDGRGDNVDALFNMETTDRNGSIKVASAGSPADLTGTSRRLVIGDDISKWEMSDKGDPEALMVSRAQAFEEAKILRTSTAMIKGTCRISRAFERSDQRFYHVPCPHCGHEAPFTWENLRKSIEPERLHAAHFTCDACGCVITHADKESMVRKGHWVPSNPKGDHPGFHLWGAYAPQRDWASIAVSYAQVMGWTTASLTGETAEAIKRQVEAETEQVFWNDVLGLPYEQASKGPDWEKLRDRAENAPEAETLPQWVLPSTGFILAAGADCQADRIEVQIVAFCRNMRRLVVGYIVIPHYIGDKEGREALDALLKQSWRTERGLKFPLDVLAIDGSTFTEDVRAFVKRHPSHRVFMVKGASSANGPILMPMRRRRADGKVLGDDRQAFIVNVSQMKADFYAWLTKEDPLERGFVGFARALGDEYFRQVTAEVRVLKRAPSGVMVSSWQLAETGRRNEALDTMNYAEAGARRKAWLSMTDLQWEKLADDRGGAPAESQGDLFDASVPVVAPVIEQKPEEAKRPANAKPDSDWIEPRADWI